MSNNLCKVGFSYGSAGELVWVVSNAKGKVSDVQDMFKSQQMGYNK